MQGYFSGQQDNPFECFVISIQTKAICLLIFLPCSIYCSQQDIGAIHHISFQSQVKWTMVFNFDHRATMITSMFSMNVDMIAERTSKGLSCPSYSVQSLNIPISTAMIKEI